ncbi:MAG: HAD-IB family hydrolase [Gemmatimonadota bacterium]|nr:HAD-IB family hydrolase [Gemmatimonadota bacterium]
MSGRAAAFFDVDGTIVASDIVRYGVEISTAEKGEWARRLWIAGFLPRIPWYLALDAFSREAFQRSFYRIYRGLDAETFEERAEALFHHYVEPRIHPEAESRLRRHARRGDPVVLVTGSVETIVRPLARHLDVRHVLAPRLEVEDGRLTGELAGEPLAGERKAEAVADWAREHDADLDVSAGYADSLDDVPMLERLGRPAVVNPGRRLLDTAVDRGWEVLHWDLPRAARGAAS